jgi:aldose sugar dehydrogenase
MMRVGFGQALLKSALLAGFLLGGAYVHPLQAQTQRIATQTVQLDVETVATGLQHPWSIAFLPDGRMLVTERPGRLNWIGLDGKPRRITGLPPIAAGGQGGLLDVALTPNFSTSRELVFSFTEPRDDGNGTSVALARLSNDLQRLDNVRIIFRQKPSASNSMHFGGRLVFARDGNLFVTLGERFTLADQAQNLNNHIGKIVRIKLDGTAPADNPFVGKADHQPEIWSYGHRNVQAAAIHPQTGALWEVEHGAQGGDEINIVLPGRNYGWPIISYGKHYSGAKIGTGVSAPGMEQPIFYWDPSIAPSGMAFVTSDLYPGWKGNLLVGALRGQLVSRLTLSGNRVTGEERMLNALNERIRDVRQGPDGMIYLATDSTQGRILRLKPVRP